MIIIILLLYEFTEPCSNGVYKPLGMGTPSIYHCKNTGGSIPPLSVDKINCMCDKTKWSSSCSSDEVVMGNMKCM